MSTQTSKSGGQADTLHADGFLFESNPSPVGGGFTVVDSEGRLLAREVYEQEGFTNNEAELLGVAHAIWLAPSGATVVTDSRVVRTWIRKGKSKARPDLNGEIKEARRSANRKVIAIVQVPRNENLAGIYNEKHPADHPCFGVIHDR